MSKSKAKRRTQKKYWGRGDFKAPAVAETKAMKIKAQTTKRERKIASIIALRGAFCFYCGDPMRTEDMTIEHLIAKSNGGTNALHNLYLAHDWCNKEAGSKYTKNKKKMRETSTEEAWHRCLIK